MLKIKRKVSLKRYTTFRIGGLAEYFFEAKTKEDIVLAIKWAQEKRLPFFVLGGGSNVLISDKGIKGLVIKTGISLAKYVNRGLEWAAGIPGTVEGAVYSNAGAFNKSMADEVISVEVYDVKDGKMKIFKNKDCRFSYRSSIFKKKKNLIILSVKVKEKKSDAKKIKEYLKQRKEKQPLNFYSAGSVFKNPLGFFTGELIEECGLKGKIIGGAKISEKHANFIINFKNASSEDVKKLIKLAKQKVKKKFKINLQEEIQFLK